MKCIPIGTRKRINKYTVVVTFIIIFGNELNKLIGSYINTKTK